MPARLASYKFAPSPRATSVATPILAGPHTTRNHYHSTPTSHFTSTPKLTFSTQPKSLFTCPSPNDLKMPVYHARSIKLSLVTSSLSTTTTAEPKKVRRDASAAAEQFNAILKDGENMKETVIPCPEDQRSLWYLGQDEDVPFYLVRVGRQDLFESVFDRWETALSRPRRLRSSGGTPVLDHESVALPNQSIIPDASMKLKVDLPMLRQIGTSISLRLR